MRDSETTKQQIKATFNRSETPLASALQANDAEIGGEGLAFAGDGRVKLTSYSLALSADCLLQSNYFCCTIDKRGWTSTHLTSRATHHFTLPVSTAG